MKFDLKTWIAWLIIGLTWGATYPVMRLGVRYYPPELFAGSRFLISGVAFLLLAKLNKQAFPQGRREWLIQALIGTCTLILCHGSCIYAAQWVWSGTMSVIIATAPVMTVLIESLWLRKWTLSRMGLGGLSICFGGVILIAMGGKQSGSSTPLGIAMILGAASFLSLGGIIAARTRTQASVWVQAGLQMLTAGVGLCIFSGLIGEWPRFAWHWPMIWTWGFMVVAGSWMGYGAFVYTLRAWGASRTNTYAYVNILIATLLGICFLNESLSLFDSLGVISIALGILLLRIFK